MKPSSRRRLGGWPTLPGSWQVQGSYALTGTKLRWRHGTLAVPITRHIATGPDMPGMKLQSIEAARGVAALMVVAFHAERRLDAANHP